MKRLLIFLSLVLVIALSSSCNTETTSTGGDNSGSQSSDVAQPIGSANSTVSLKLAFGKDEVALDAGDDEGGYFTIEGSDELTSDDIEFVSSDPLIATFEYDKTTLDKFIYFKISALRAGETTVFAQTKDGSAKTAEIRVSVAGYIYDTERIDDISVGNTPRFTSRVVAERDYIDSMTDEQIGEMMEFIAKKYADSHKVCASCVFLYYIGDNIDEGYTIGSSTYAPEGDISKAVDAEAGEYADFSFDTEVIPRSSRGS